jgi:4'-phosphopantetheinyl transferase
VLSVRRWRPADPVDVPPPGRADAWIVALDGVPSDEAASADLAPDEIARARRLRFEEDRHRFVASRLALRRILGGCLKTAPRAIVLCAGPFGKPALDPGIHGTEIRFNVAHSGALALVAVGHALEVGVDVERHRPLPELEALGARYFSPRERSTLASLPVSRRTAAFFEYWTLKEAYLKACGDGLNRRLDAFDVALNEGSSPRLLEVRDRPGDERLWTLARLRPAEGYAAAVVIEEIAKRWQRT